MSDFLCVAETTPIFIIRYRQPPQRLGDSARFPGLSGQSMQPLQRSCVHFSTTPRQSHPSVKLIQRSLAHMTRGAMFNMLSLLTMFCSPFIPTTECRALGHPIRACPRRTARTKKYPRILLKRPLSKGWLSNDYLHGMEMVIAAGAPQVRFILHDSDTRVSVPAHRRPRLRLLLT